MEKIEETTRCAADQIREILNKLERKNRELVLDSIVKEYEEEEAYECPECGADITSDMSACPNCGVGLSFEIVEDTLEETDGTEEQEEDEE